MVDPRLLDATLAHLEPLAMEEALHEAEDEVRRLEAEARWLRYGIWYRDYWNSKREQAGVVSLYSLRQGKP